MAEFNVSKLQLELKSMLKKLNDMYDKEENLKFEFKKIVAELQQLDEDKELLQNMIMFQSNKLDRIKNFRR